MLLIILEVQHQLAEWSVGLNKYQGVSVYQNYYTRCAVYSVMPRFAFLTSVAPSHWAIILEAH